MFQVLFTIKQTDNKISGSVPKTVKMSKKKTLTGEELEHLINTTGALSNLDEDEEAVDNEGLGTNIHDDEMTASDEEVEDQDQIELELMYDSDYDKDYVPSYSEASDNVEGSEDAEKKSEEKEEKEGNYQKNT